MAQYAFIPVRLILAIIFIAHGGQKLFGLFGGSGLDATAQGFAQMGFVPAKLWALLAGLAEFGGGISVLAGFLTRFGALAISVVMLVAIFKVHFAQGLLGQGGYEHALACLGLALSLLLAGAGPLFNLDETLFKKK